MLTLRMDESRVPKSESTSWHKLSADDPLSKIQRVQWIACNLLNNALPRMDNDQEIEERKFRLSESALDALWAKINAQASPARRLCDLFWLTLPWEELTRELRRVSVLEIGCGTGGYGRLLQKCLGECFDFYLGVDIKANEQWRTVPESTGFAFKVARASEAYKFLPGSNLICTQSALEHFDEDLSYFSQVASYVATSEHPILQIHLIPSRSCISTFAWHGIRQYTPRTIARITRLFDAETKKYLFSLRAPLLGGR